MNDSGELMYLAGIFEKRQFTIITRDATPTNEKIHHRQPVIINKSKINEYLNVKNDALEVLNTINPPDLSFYQIGFEINNPKNNSSDLINPLKAKKLL